MGLTFRAFSSIIISSAGGMSPLEIDLCLAFALVLCACFALYIG